MPPPIPKVRMPTRRSTLSGNVTGSATGVPGRDYLEPFRQMRDDDIQASARALEVKRKTGSLPDLDQPVARESLAGADVPVPAPKLKGLKEVGPAVRISGDPVAFNRSFKARYGRSPRPAR